MQGFVLILQGFGNFTVRSQPWASPPEGASEVVQCAAEQAVAGVWGADSGKMLGYGRNGNSFTIYYNFTTESISLLARINGGFCKFDSMNLCEK